MDSDDNTKEKGNLLGGGSRVQRFDGVYDGLNLFCRGRFETVPYLLRRNELRLYGIFKCSIVESLRATTSPKWFISRLF